MAEKVESLDKNTSAKYANYVHQFPQKVKQGPSTGNVVFTYDELKQFFGRQFEFSVLDGIFSAAIQRVNQSGTLPALNQLKEPSNLFTAAFEYDHLTWPVTLERSCYLPQGRNDVVGCLTIRIPNDGFIYKKIDEVPVLKKAPRRHHSDCYYLLNQSITSEFPSVYDFFLKYFNVTGTKVFYNFEEDRLDILAIDADSNHVKVSFEKMDPLIDFDDCWLPV